MGDPYLHGIKHLEAMAEAEIQSNQEKKLQAERQKLISKGDILRIINADEVVKFIQLYVKSQYDACDAQLKDPKVTDINTIMLLKGELQAHSKYVEMFSIWESEGKAALKKLLDQEKAGKNGGE